MWTNLLSVAAQRHRYIISLIESSDGETGNNKHEQVKNKENVLLGIVCCFFLWCLGLLRVVL